MKKSIVLQALLVFVPIFSIAQIVYTENSLAIRPAFRLGDKKTYAVSDENKIESSPLFPVKAEHQFEVSFTVLDTTNGYTIVYDSKTISTKNSNWQIESIQAEISSGLQLIYKIDRDGEIIALMNIESVRSALFAKLDAIIKKTALSSSEKKILSALQDTLRNKRGVELFIKPLVLFSALYAKPIFYTHKTYLASNRVDILGEPGLPGVIIPQLRKIIKSGKQAILQFEFIGNKDSAAKYTTPLFLDLYHDIKGKTYHNPADLPSEMKNDFEGEYIVNFEGWQIQEIHYKSTEFFIEKVVTKTTMILKE